MNQTALGRLALVALVSASGTAHADIVESLGTLSAPASVAFANDTASHLSLSALSLPTPFNFLDRWTFTLAGDATVTSLAAAFLFDDGAGGLATFGISDLQVNLLDGANVVATSWQTVAMSSPFTQTIAVTPAAGLQAGNYTLQVRGHLQGAPAAYSGSLIASGAPAVVPLPASLPLLLAGLAGLAAVSRRRDER